MTDSAPDVVIGVDLRVEAVMGAMAIAVPWLPHAGWIDHAARRRARRSWSSLRDHPAPRVIRALLGPRFWVDDLLRLALTLLGERDARDTDHAGFDSEAPALTVACRRLAEALVDFTVRARLADVLTMRGEIAADVAESTGGEAAVWACRGALAATLGPGPAAVRVTPSPLSNAHLGYGLSIGPPERRESWIVFGPVWRPERRPWRLVGFRSRKLRRVVRHELGHSHLNPLTARSASLVARYADLFHPMAPAMRAAGYGRWDICLNEHVLRALEAQVVRAEAGRSSLERFLSREERKGFALIRPALAALDGLRDTALEAAYPEFLERLARGAGDRRATSRTAPIPAAV